MHIAPAAISTFYGSDSFLLIGHDVEDVFLPLVPAEIPALTLSADGAIGDPSHKSEADLCKFGDLAPGGLIAIICGTETSSAARDILALYSFVSSHHYPEILTYPVDEENAAGILVRALSSALTARTRSAGEIQTSLAALRQDHEALLIKNHWAGKILSQCSVDSGLIVQSLPAGRETVGPGGDVKRTIFRQRLSVDSVAIKELRLFPAKETSDDSTVKIALIREYDDAVLEQWTCHSADINSDVLRLPLSKELCGGIFDISIEIAWPDECKGLHFYVSDVRGDRFGESETGISLAHDIIRNLESTQDGIPVLYPSARIRPCDLDLNIVDGVDVPELEELTPLSIISRNHQEGWLQIHPINEPHAPEFSAQLSLSEDVRRLKFQFLTAHAQGPVVDYSVRVSGHRKDGAAYQVQSQCRALPDVQTDIVLDLPRDREWGVIISFSVRAVAESISYGWCRITDILLLQTTEHEPSKQKNKYVYRYEQFPNIGWPIHYLAGDNDLISFNAEMGSNALLFSSEKAYVQTHPVKDRLSGVRLEGFITAGSCATGITYENAHEGAAPFVFAFFVISQELGKSPELEAILRSHLAPFLLKVSNEDTPEEAEIKNANDDVSIHARLVGGGDSGTLSIDLDYIVGEPRTAVFAVVPISDNIDFGWCRWRSIWVKTQVEN